jgi:hypothetical protein
MSLPMYLKNLHMITTLCTHLHLQDTPENTIRNTMDMKNIKSLKIMGKKKIMKKIIKNIKRMKNMMKKHMDEIMKIPMKNLIIMEHLMGILMKNYMEIIMMNPMDHIMK